MPGFDPVGSAPVGSIGGDFATAGKIVFHGSNATANQNFPNAGRLTFLGSLPILVTARPRVTWFGLETLHVGAASARVTWEGVEILRTVASIPTDWVVSWMGVEALHTGAASARVTWFAVEALHVGQAADRVTWIGLEVLRSLADMPPDTGFVYLIC